MPSQKSQDGRKRETAISILVVSECRLNIRKPKYGKRQNERREDVLIAEFLIRANKDRMEGELRRKDPFCLTKGGGVVEGGGCD